MRRSDRLPNKEGEAVFVACCMEILVKNAGSDAPARATAARREPGEVSEITDVLATLLRGADHGITQAAGQSLVTIPLRM